MLHQGLGLHLQGAQTQAQQEGLKRPVRVGHGDLLDPGESWFHAPWTLIYLEVILILTCEQNCGPSNKRHMGILRPGTTEHGLTCRHGLYRRDSCHEVMRGAPSPRTTSPRKGENWKQTRTEGRPREDTGRRQPGLGWLHAPRPSEGTDPADSSHGDAAHFRWLSGSAGMAELQQPQDTRHTREPASASIHGQWWGWQSPRDGRWGLPRRLLARRDQVFVSLPGLSRDDFLHPTSTLSSHGIGSSLQKRLYSVACLEVRYHHGTEFWPIRFQYVTHAPASGTFFKREMAGTLGLSPFLHPMAWSAM